MVDNILSREGVDFKNQMIPRVSIFINQIATMQWGCDIAMIALSI